MSPAERVRLFLQLVQGDPVLLPQPGHKVAEGSEAPHEPLNVFNVPDLAHFGNGQNLVGVYFNAALGDDDPRILLMRGWFLIFLEVEVDRLVEISTLVKKALNR
jgi:hypothetical protein